MHLPTRSLFLTLSLALAAPAVAADQILIAGAGGQVHRAQASTGVFTPLTTTPMGAIAAMVHQGENLYVADVDGGIFTFDLGSGALESFVSVPITPTSLAVSEGLLFIGGGAGNIMRLDLVTGGLTDARPAPTQINALAVHDGYVYAAGLDGAIYRAHARGGTFTYFTCFCFFDIRAMTVIHDRLYVQDAFGLLGVVDLGSGFIVNAFVVPAGSNTLVAQEGDLLVHTGGGVVSRVNRRTGLGEDYYFTPFPLTAMEVVRDRRPSEVVQALGMPQGQHRR